MSRPGSFRERVAWSALSTYVVVFGVYFWTLGERFAEQPNEPGNANASLMGLGAFLLVALAQKLGERFEAPRREVKPDEREQLIAFKADRIALYTLACSAIAITAAALVYGFSALLLANLVIVALVLAQTAKTVAQIFYFKAGA